ncbi:MAG: integrin alpha [Planctomycetota bacterium]
MFTLWHRRAYLLFVLLPWPASAAQVGGLCPGVAEVPTSEDPELHVEALAQSGRFGSALAALGDLGNDGTIEIVAGAPAEPGSGGGGLWLISIWGPSSATPNELASIEPLVLPPAVQPADGDRFGAALTRLGDTDCDGSQEIAVGAPGESGGAGALYVLELNPDLTLSLVHHVDATHACFAGGVAAGDELGTALARLGDLDGDGYDDLAVGAPGCDDGGVDRGAMWILFSGTGGAPQSAQKISASGGAPAHVSVDGRFGSALAKLGRFDDPGDLDADGRPDVAVGAPELAGGGGLWILFLDDDGTAKDGALLPAACSALAAELEEDDRFGASVAALEPPPGELSGLVLAVGAPGAADWVAGQGALWYLLLSPQGDASHETRISAGKGGFAGFLGAGDGFGSSIALAGDLDGDGMGDVLTGAPGDDVLGPESGTVWRVLLGPEVEPRVLPYGEAGNPVTLTASGDPRIGEEVQFQLAPSAQISGPADVYLTLSWSPDPLAPVGSPLAGFLGLFLVDPLQGMETTGPIWIDPTCPLAWDVFIDENPSYEGNSVYVQASVVTPGQAYLSNGLQLVVGGALP